MVAAAMTNAAWNSWTVSGELYALPLEDRVVHCLEYDRPAVPFQPGKATAVDAVVQRPTAERDASRQIQQQ
jgi:hypothetical protein